MSLKEKECTTELYEVVIGIIESYFSKKDIECLEEWLTSVVEG